MNLGVILGVLLVLSFLGLVYYAVKGGNLMLGILLIALFWTAVAIVGKSISFNDALANIIQKGPEGWGPVLINFFFGAWFGRVMLDTGIASTIIRKVIELGGDKPILSMILLSTVTTLIFTSMFGTGAVVAIGIIILPIYMSLGIPKKLGLVTFMTSVGAGLYINPVIFTQYRAFYTNYNYDANYLKWGFSALGVQLGVTIIVILFTLLTQKKKHMWQATPANAEKSKHVPFIALITPFIPVVLAIVFKWPVIPGFLIAGFFALFVCKRTPNFAETAKVFNKTFYDGVIDTAPLVGFMMVIPIFNAASSYVTPFFQTLLGPIIPKSALAICIAFAVIAPLGLFRGPLTLAGSGAATLGILKGLGFPDVLLFPLMYAPTVTMNISSCVTQSWIVWGINYTKIETKDFLKMSIPIGWAICAILSGLTYYLYA